MKFERVGRDTAHAAKLLRSGKLVAIPTETVYGLAANGIDGHAVSGIFAAKRRPFFDPLILHVPTLEAMRMYATHIPEKIEKLIEAFSPGPITFVLPKSDMVPDIVSSGLPTVGLRIPRHPMTLDLLQQLDFPLAAPSANVFGYISPTHPRHVDKQFGRELEYILDGGSCSLGLESTIVDGTGKTVRILRKGSLEMEAIASVLGYQPKIEAVSTSRPTAPGNIDVHYAPKTPLWVGDVEKMLRENSHGVGVMLFGTLQADIGYAKVQILSEAGDLREAAVNFFSALHHFDEDPTIKYIYCAPFPEEGLGSALNDRLRRAGTRLG